METHDIESVNPASEEILARFRPHDRAEVDAALERGVAAQRKWRRLSFDERAEPTAKLARLLTHHQQRLAEIITSEMGKPIAQAKAEIAKCAVACDYFAGQAERYLAAQPHPSDATESYVEFVPLGCIFAIMPWNFPFWQVIRFAAPALMAGNTGVLKHASNVPQCARAIEDLFTEAGFPAGAFQSLLLPGAAAGEVVADPRIAAVTLTGSERAGAQVAEAAGRVVKKSVLELGGSDPFIVLADAHVEAAVEFGVRSRFQNAGQSCIAAKRFIVEAPVFDRFQELFVRAVKALRVGDPMLEETEVGPLARADLRDTLERQVQQSVEAGARVLVGGKRREGRGYFFEPTVVTDVPRHAPLAREEVFGPVAALMSVHDVDQAIARANDSPYGLGSNLWTRNVARARTLAREIEAGQVFINGMVASDPRLPFGGVKQSGYGRELSEYGIREFVNIQTVWIGPKR